MRNTWKNAPHLGKFGTLGKMCHSQENAAHLENCATLKKMRLTSKNAPHLTKCGTLDKMCHSQENAAYLEKWARLNNMLHT